MKFTPAKALQILLTGLISIPIFQSCSTKVSRVDPDSTIDLSGRWNDADSRLVAKEMVQSAMEGNWYNPYLADSIVPTIIVGEIRNKSHEHINTGTFVKDIEKALINSGKVNFVASKAERGQIREEKQDQAENASAQSQKLSGEESGADLMMIGTINTIVDQQDNEAVVFYQVDMELIDIESHRKLWIGDKKIKKYVSRAKAKF